MSVTKRIFFSLCAALIFCPAAQGFDGNAMDGSILENEVAAIYGKACEKFKNGEPKSSARVRVIDKASYAAVDSLSLLDDFRAVADPQDYNIVVYNLVDNAVEDLSVRTLKQDDTDICVEVTGYVSKKNVQLALKDAESKEETIAEEENNTEEQTVSKAEKPTEFPIGTAKNPDGKISLWIEPTEFYNNTSSDKFAEFIAKEFEGGDIVISRQKENADYIIQSNVLRAKVDPINSDTSRLQMIVAVELRDADGNRISTQHQNRFVLFSAEEDEQEVAFRLMKKLFENACERILQKIRIIEPKDNDNRLFEPIITPGGHQTATD